MPYVVTRQMQWPNGKLIVEVSEGDLDYTNPDALVQKYQGEFEEFDDPREAADIAIEIMKLWKENDPSEEIFLGYGCTCGMTIPFEDCTPEELKAWAQKAYEATPECNECREKITGEEWKIAERTDNLKFCSEDCAEAFFVKNIMEE